MWQDEMAGTRDKIIIVGGGTAGWLTAAYLARRLGTRQAGGVAITLIESPVIPTIGVGEGTLPSLRLTLATIGVDEADFMRNSDAAFKQGIRFRNWCESAGSNPHEYFHPFNSPRALGGHALAPYWALNREALPCDYADAVTPQIAMVTQNRAPKRLTDQSYSGPMNYAYHLDVHKFAAYLTRVATALGVEHVVDHVEHAVQDGRGEISSLRCRETGSHTADLFVDCTGFGGRLIEKELGTELTEISGTLFCDRATAVQVPYETPDAPLASATVSTAQDNGWTWDIALPTRRGVGYVWSSAHTDEVHAEKVLEDYLGAMPSGASARHLKMRTGYRKTQWKGNCIAVGLSAGFLEPLESTGILLVEAAATLIADWFPRRGRLEPVAKAFNRAMTERYENAIDFIKMHFHLSDRDDTDFWRDNRRSGTAPDSLREKLEAWQFRLPTQYDMCTVHESFRHINYEYILMGMGRVPGLADQAAAFPHHAAALREFQAIRTAATRAAEALPDHRALINQVQTASFAAQRPAQVSH